MQPLALPELSHLSIYRLIGCQHRCKVMFLVACETRNHWLPGKHFKGVTQRDDSIERFRSNFLEEKQFETTYR